MSRSIQRAVCALAVGAALGGSAIAFAAAGSETSQKQEQRQGTEAPPETETSGTSSAGDAEQESPATPPVREEQPSADEKPTASAEPDPCREAPAEPGPQPDPPVQPVQPAAPEPTPPKPSAAELLGDFDPLEHRRVNGHLVSDLKDQWRAVLSLHPALQEHVEGVFRQYRVPFGAVVAVEPSTGRVLAYVSHSSADANAGDLARNPAPPSASVFKVITAAALLDAGVKPDSRVCYGGGMRRLVMADLVDDQKRDRHCLTFQDALGYSANAIFAKLADRHLDARKLARYASAFGFGHSLPFDTRTNASPMEVPKDRLERARTAAGFWHMYMSPLHGALIAATVANGGVMPRASMIDRIVDGSGEVLARHAPASFRAVIPGSTADVLGRMMTRTITHGTARRSFYDPAGRPFLPGISVAGKTGSLTQQQPYRAYSWWIGFAPVDTPRIAVAALVVNEPKWRIKSSYVARETLRYYLKQTKR